MSDIAAALSPAWTAVWPKVLGQRTAEQIRAGPTKENSAWAGYKPLSCASLPPGDPCRVRQGSGPRSGAPGTLTGGQRHARRAYASSGGACVGTMSGSIVCAGAGVLPVRG